MPRQGRLTDEEQERFDQYVQEFRAKPLDYVRHDANARFDEELRKATARYGMEFYGSWWLLVELLSGDKRHFYPVHDEDDWRLFAIDMSTGGVLWTVEKCKEFCDRLAEHRLIDPESYGRGKVINNRICKEVEKYATAAAGKALGSWKTNRKAAG